MIASSSGTKPPLTHTRPGNPAPSEAYCTRSRTFVAVPQMTLVVSTAATSAPSASDSQDAVTSSTARGSWLTTVAPLLTQGLHRPLVLIEPDLLVRAVGHPAGFVGPPVDAVVEVDVGPGRDRGQRERLTGERVPLAG